MNLTIGIAGIETYLHILIELIATITLKRESIVLGIDGDTLLRGVAARQIVGGLVVTALQTQVVELRKIICVKCIYFVRSSQDGFYHGACHYNDDTQQVRTWSILSCMDRGGFVPKVNVDTEKVRGELNEWINRNDPAVGEM